MRAFEALPCGVIKLRGVLSIFTAASRGPQCAKRIQKRLVRTIWSFDEALSAVRVRRILQTVVSMHGGGRCFIGLVSVERA